MKKIIKGKKYDTNTAERIADYETALSQRDFNYYQEELYKKQNGEFFLFGEGGPLTKYAETLDGGMRGYGEKIIPLTILEAMDWVEENCSYSTYVELFGEPEE